MRLSLADYDGRTALHLAAAEGHLDCVQFLLQVGVPPTLRDRYDGIWDTIWDHWAAQVGLHPAGRGQAIRAHRGGGVPVELAAGKTTGTAAILT